MEFKAVGTLSKGKDTEKMTWYEEKRYDSGWTNRVAKFNVKNGNSRQLLQIKGGTYPEGHAKKSFVYSFTKSTVDENGEKVKGEKITIPFADRLKPEIIDKVAEFKKFVVDLDDKGYLRKTFEKVLENGSATDEELEKLGVSSFEEVKPAYEMSLKKKKVFIHEWDFAEFVNKLIDSGKYKDKKFYVSGEIENSFSEYSGKFYQTIVPKRITLTSDDKEEFFVGTAKVIFGENSLDTSYEEENNKAYLDAYVFGRDNNLKKDIPAPIKIVFDKGTTEDDAKKYELYKSRFTVDDGVYYESGIEFDMINGTEMVAISYDDLDDDTKELIDLGITTIEEVSRELGGSKAGSYIQENRFKGLSRGYVSKNKEATAYEAENLDIGSYLESGFELVTQEEDLDDLFG